ncbi:MAG: O-antigen ligase family protein [Bacteroidia bacterium]
MILEKIKLNKNSIFFSCLVASIITLPFSIKINTVCIILLVVAWLFKNSLHEKIKLLNNPTFFLFSALYFLYVLGMFWTNNIQHGFFELEKKFALFLFPLIFFSIPPLKDSERNKIFFFFVLSCALLAIVCLFYASYRTYSANSFFEINAESGYVTHYFFYFGLSEAFIHPVYFSAYIVFSLVILFNYYSSSKELLVTKKRVLIVFLILFFIGFLCLLSSRIMIVYLSICSVCYFLYLLIKRKSSKGRVILGFFVLVSMLLAVIYVPAIRSRFSEIVSSSYRFENNPENNKNLSGKLDGVEMKLAQWYFTVQAGKNNKLIGVGTGDDEDELQKKYFENNFMEGYVPRYNSHNQWFQTWLALGFLGLSVLVATFLFPLFNTIKQKQFLYLFFLALIMFFFLTESVLCRQHGVVFYSFFNSLFATSFLRK